MNYGKIKIGLNKVKTFYEDTGIRSDAGELLLKDLKTNPRQRTRFIRLLNHFRFELRHVKTYMASRLIFEHFKDRIINSSGKCKISFKLNVLKCVFDVDMEKKNRIKWDGAT